MPLLSTCRVADWPGYWLKERAVGYRLAFALEVLRGKLWLPHQVAREFHKNRVAVIHAQRRRYDERVRQPKS
jgi:hypothetical protein